MLRNFFGPLLQTTLLIIAIAGCYVLFAGDIEPDEGLGGWSCPAIAGCNSNGCSGSIRKKCTYTSIDGATCPEENWCQFRF